MVGAYTTVRGAVGLRKVVGRRLGDVQLGPADDPQLRVRVEVVQRRAIPVDRRLPRHECDVVGLGLVGDHVDLVTLPVTEEDVLRTGVGQQIEVGDVLVDVEDNVGQVRVHEVVEISQPPGQQHRQRGHRAQRHRDPRISYEQRDRGLLGHRGKRGQPVPDLVQVLLAGAEVDEDAAVLRAGDPPPLPGAQSGPATEHGASAIHSDAQRSSCHGPNLMRARPGAARKCRANPGAPQRSSIAATARAVARPSSCGQ